MCLDFTLTSASVRPGVEFSMYSVKLPHKSFLILEHFGFGVRNPYSAPHFFLSDKNLCHVNMVHFVGVHELMNV